MKRLYGVLAALIMALVLMMSMTACGGSEDAADAGAPEDTAAQEEEQPADTRAVVKTIEGVDAALHTGELLDGAFVVLHRIHHGTGVEEVGTGLLPLFAFEHIICEGLVLIPFHEEGLGDDAGEAHLALVGSLLHHCGTVIDYVVVVL